MMRRFAYYLLLVLGGVSFISCGEGIPLHGTLQATLGEKEYETDAVCVHLDEDRFKFKTEGNTLADEKDVFISGKLLNNRLTLLIKDHGVVFSTKNLADWEKDSKGARGYGILYNEDAATQSHQVSFELSCDGHL